MSKEFSNDSEEKVTRGSSKQAQLLVLLVLLAAFGYLYFFTGIIKPREEAAQPPAQVAQVKQPMPPRAEPQPSAPADQQTAAAPAPAAAPVAAAGGQAPAAPAAAAATATTATPVAPTAPSGKASPAAAPAKKEVAQVEKTEKPAQEKTAVKQAASPAAKKPLQAVSTKTVEKNAAPAEKKTVAAEQKTATKPAGKKVAGAYRLKVGDYLFAKDEKAAEAVLKKQGVAPIVLQKSTKATTMHRLFYAEHTSRDSATADLEQFKLKAPDAFVIQENGKYVIYAGSYAKEARGAIEQDRLFDKGLSLVMKKTQVKVPVTQLTAGSFASEGDARNAAAALKKKGIHATVIKAGSTTDKK